MLIRFTLFILAGVLLMGNAPAAGQEPDTRVYEMRTYYAPPGKLDDLHARFRDHTTKLFEKHGISNVAYWVPTDEPKSKNTLIYVISHNDRDASKASWQAFINDPVWKAAAAASEKDGKILAERPTAIFMKLMDYSPKAE